MTTILREYLPEVQKQLRGQYSSVQVKQAKLASILLCGTWTKLVYFRFISAGFSRHKIHSLRWFQWKQSEWLKTEQVRIKSKCLYVPHTFLPSPRTILKENIFLRSLQKQLRVNIPQHTAQASKVCK